MASNSSVIADPQGRFEDWIELHNTAKTPINVGGLYLTDDANEPAKWQIPLGNRNLTNIPAGGFLVVWADGDTTDAGLHASFKLNADGDSLYLFEADGVTRIDSVEFGIQIPNVSYGRYPDGSAEWQFLSLATPGAANVQAYAGLVADPTFSREHGFYDQPFEIAIACDTPDAVIYYTTDGSEPYKEGGRFPNGKAYAGPIRIGQTTCLRARAIKPGWRSSKITTQTYIFLNQVFNQPNAPVGFPTAWGGISADYAMNPGIVTPQIRAIREGLESLPTMSLIMTLDDLFGATQGIYANPNGTSASWERPASIEMIWPDGQEGFQANCGARIYGDVGRREKKKSIRLLFKGMYGQTKLEYPLFGAEAAQEFDTFILRANFNDGYPFGQAKSQYLRDEYSRRLQLALGQSAAHGRYIHLYINGLYWGLYNPVERPDASFAAEYCGGDKDDWDAYNSGSPTGGSTGNSYNGMLNAARQGVSTNQGYQKLQGNNPDGMPNPAYVNWLDVDNYIDYLIVNFFVGNTDWPHKNWYGAMNRVHSTGFKCFCWDTEWVMDLALPGWSLSSNLTSNVVGVGNGIAEPYGLLRQNPEFCLRFADHVHRAFFNGGPLYVAPGRSSWDPAHPEDNRPAASYAELAGTIEKATLVENARWGDVSGTYTMAQWRTERDYLVNTYLVQRPGIVLGQLRSAGLYPGVDAPVFQVNGTYQHGGHVATNATLSMTGGTVWYTCDGNDPRVSAQTPQATNSTTLIAENAPKQVLVPTRDIGDTWKSGSAFDDSAWTAVTTGPGGIGYERGSGYQPYLSLDLGTQMYDKQATCYIRIPFTTTSTAYSSLLLKVRYDDGFIAYLNGTEVARRNFTGTPRWNSVGSTDNPDAAAVGQTTIDISASLNALKSGANLLALHGLNGTLDSSDMLISVELAAAKGAPGSTAPAGVSPTALRYTGPVTLSKSTLVKARTLSGTTWSALNEAVFAVGPVAQSLRVSEIMYHPADSGNPGDPNTEYLELTNIAGQSINLNLVRFTDGIDYTFPSFDLPAGGYCLIVKDLAAFQAKYGSKLPVVGEYGGSLDNGGERIELVDAIGEVIQSFTYDDSWFKNTDGQGYSLTVKDPEATDVNSLNDKAAWQAASPSPGRAGP
ncbi:MAG: lamin tail domain-containing protein [Planctomycetes bacterium]|nr:lamin tail domain-containing protein [Planctomycetota bacterium]